jgi:glycyl-tRNA synthetase beta chain
MEAKTGSRDIVRVRKQIIALSEISGQEDFEPLTTTFKRVMNIIPDGETPEVQEKLFKEKAEKSLHAAYRERGDKIRELLQAEHYAEALREIASLRPEVDLFFEDVLVMDKDEKLKNNRLGLLSAIGGLFSQVADFRKIVSN